jgi:hypothetical protein
MSAPGYKGAIFITFRGAGFGGHIGGDALRTLQEFLNASRIPLDLIFLPGTVRLPIAALERRAFEVIIDISTLHMDRPSSP